VNDRRARIAECIDHLGHVLPGQASIRDFVHHNTIHGFQHLPFPQALAAVRERTGITPWLDEARCRGFYRAGRIDESDFTDALDTVCRAVGIDPETPLIEGVACGAVIRAALLDAISPVPLARFRWLVEEEGALAGQEDLWAACLEVLDIDARFDHPETLFEVAAREEKDAADEEARQDAIAVAAANVWESLTAKLGADMTAQALLEVLTGEDALAVVRPVLIRHLGAHLDLGIAAWRNPARARGFFAAWKESAVVDIAWPLDNLSGAREAVAALPDDATEAILAELARLGLPEARWPAYLERLALELPGWSGMFLWRAQRPGYAGTADTPVAMADYLAVRLVLERLVGDDIARRYWGVAFTLPALGAYFQGQPAELWVRHARHADVLPEYLLDLVEPYLGPARAAEDAAPWLWLAGRIDAWRNNPNAEQAARHGPTRAAWPLFRLCRALDVGAERLRAAGRAGAEALLGALDALDIDQRGLLWLLAYERHYREQIFAGLAANHGRWPGHADGPAAQLVFCMDDREEGMRRHLEEIAPELETLGGAAHFAVYQNYTGIDDEAPTPLCPVVPEVVVPSHSVREEARVGAGETARHHARRQRRQRFATRLDHLTRRGVFGGALAAAVAAPFALAGMLWRTLTPGGFGLRSAVWLPGRPDALPTRLAAHAPDDAGPASPQAPRAGFTDAEGAERVGNYLTALGLTRHFAPLVIIVGHGANSTNNPHLAAYDCGACAGRHSGPNARLFAALANRPGVRARLAERGIVLPETTWFLSAEHNTTDDGMLWYDLEDLPEMHCAGFARVDAALAVASRAHAQERCRRLFSAPLDLDPAAALRHVIGRRYDWSQARPELGHATNACAFVGRRALSRGAFFDRRSFLISYDPTQDPDGKVLERHLLINGAVGAGISLEYFFSTANNAQFGCGSKVTHNLVGLFGVMQGAASDLATGLPQQMIEVHEAMRLLVVIEQTLEIITAVYLRQPPLQELVGNAWVVVAAKHPDTGAIHLFDPARGWLPWQPWQGGAAVPTYVQSVDWFRGKREALPPVLLEKPLLEKPLQGVSA